VVVSTLPVQAWTPEPAPAADAFSLDLGADSWGAALDQAAPPAPPPVVARAPVELPPDDEPMELASAHEFMQTAAEAAQGTAGVGPAWTTQARTTVEVGGEIAFEDGNAEHLELAFEPPSRMAADPPGEPAVEAPVVAAPETPAWDAQLAAPDPTPSWTVDPVPAVPEATTPAWAPPPAAPTADPAPSWEVEPAATLPQPTPAWNVEPAVALPPPPTPSWPAPEAAAVALPAAAAPSWNVEPVAAPETAEPAWDLAAMPAEPPPPELAPAPPAQEPALPPEPPVLAMAPPPPAPILAPAEDATPSWGDVVATAPEVSAPPPAWTVPAEQAAPPAPLWNDAAPVLAEPPPPLPVVSTGPASDMPSGPRMLSKEFASLSTSLDPALERSGRFPVMELGAALDQSSPPTVTQEVLYPGLAAPPPPALTPPPASTSVEAPAWETALDIAPVVEPVPEPTPPMSQLFAAGEVVTDPVQVRPEPVAQDLPLPPPELPAEPTPPPAAVHQDPSWGLLAMDAAPTVAPSFPSLEPPPAPPVPPPAAFEPPLVADADIAAWNVPDLLEPDPPPAPPAPAVEPVDAAAADVPSLDAADFALVVTQIPAGDTPVAPLPPLSVPPPEPPAQDPLDNLEAGAVASLARLFIKKGLLSTDEVVEALSKPPTPRDKP
jgi:hypothetical protein